MREKRPINLEASIRRRLLNISREKHENYNLGLICVALIVLAVLGCSNKNTTNVRFLDLSDLKSVWPGQVE